MFDGQALLHEHQTERERDRQIPPVQRRPSAPGVWCLVRYMDEPPFPDDAQASTMATRHQAPALTAPGLLRGAAGAFSVASEQRSEGRRRYLGNDYFDHLAGKLYTAVLADIRLVHPKLPG